MQITYDTAVTSLDEILKCSLRSVTPHAQSPGADVGTQYRSVIFYKDEAQKQAALSIIADLKMAKAFERPIVTTLEPFVKFYKVEDYHQDYYQNNKAQPYCKMVVQPKLEKFEKVFKDWLKKE